METSRRFEESFSWSRHSHLFSLSRPPSSRILLRSLITFFLSSSVSVQTMQTPFVVMIHSFLFLLILYWVTITKNTTKQTFFVVVPMSLMIHKHTLIEMKAKQSKNKQQPSSA